LECLERPRFFAGQLLTEAELNSAQDYVRAKNRLHNRYLHGWGVVCGLEVVCNDCDGFVTIKKGYAIDPCGEDIVVCEEQSFDVIKAIRDLCNARRRKRKGDCDPYQPAPPPSCQGIEEHWCITIAYEEKEARPITMLRQDKSSSCTCGCGGGESCSCGCRDSQNGSRSNSGSSCGCSSGTKTNGGSSTAGACEPTRILEGYRLGIIEELPECATSKTNDDRSGLAKLAAALAPDSLPMRAFNCIRDAAQYITDRVSANDLLLLGQIAAATGPVTLPAGTSAQVVHDAICRVRQAVEDLYLEGCHNTRCQLLHVFDQITCRPPDEEEVADPNLYAANMKPSVDDLVALVVQYILDCICNAFIPPCSPDPRDDRLILACLTVKDGKIIDICNFGCRHYAGAFPSFFYWLSVIPIVPLIKMAVQQFCCGPGLVHANSPLVNELMDWMQRVDPTGNVRSAFASGNFALPKNFAREISAAVSKVTVSNIAQRLVRPDSVNLPTFVGTPAAGTTKKLDAAGIEVGSVREVASADDARRIKNLTMNPLAVRGDKVVLYQMNNKVVGFGPYDAAEQRLDTEKRLQDLTAEVNGLKKLVHTMSKGRNR
jgi:hypothetical protein